MSIIPYIAPAELKGLKMDELASLRKKIVELEHYEGLFRKTEKKLQEASKDLKACEEQLRIANQQLQAKSEKALLSAPKEIEKCEIKYRKLVDTASDAIYLSSENGIIIDINQGAISMLGKERGEIEGHSVASVDPNYPTEKFLDFWKDIPLDKQLRFETTHQHKNGDLIPVELSAKKFKQDGKVYYYSLARDISDRKKSEAELKKIEWLLRSKKKTYIKSPDYGNLTVLNQDRTILDSVGEEVLNGIVTDYLSLLDTSAAVYEKNGDYAVGIFSSEWCKFLDCASRSLCKSKDNKEAMESGRWLCHESCWADASKRSIQTNKAVDIECRGGIHIYAIPVKANNEIIGSINFAYGDPPLNDDRLTDIAAKYKVSVDKLKDLAKNYETRPAFITDIAKERLESSARLIGNIVERKFAEQALQESESKFREMANLLPQIIFESDVNGNLSYVNKTAYAILGYPEDYPILGKSSLDFYTLESKLRVLENISQKLDGSQKNVNNEYTMVRKDGSTFPALVYSTPIEKGGKSVGLRGMIVDISQIKKVELELLKAKAIAEENEIKFKAAFYTSPDSVNINKMDGEYVEINEGFTRLTGYTIDDVIGKRSLEIDIWARPKDREKLVNALQEFGIIENLESIFKTKDGRLVPALMSAKIITLQDEPHILSVTRIISERKKFEQELIEAKEKAEESERLKSAFLANMSHEIRTPMNGILGFTKLLQQPNLSGEEQNEFIDIIQKSGERMLNTVNDIINISRIESGLVELSFSEVNINAQLKDLHSFFTLEAARKGILFVLKNDISGKDIRLRTDLDKLISILTNLIKNAIKFTDKGSIELGYNVNKTNGSSKLEFYVKDTGIGIPPNRREAIFERFVQADIDDKLAKQGSGLGLAISKAYAQMLKGNIWVDSEVGKGSTFYFTIENNYVSEIEASTNNDDTLLIDDIVSRTLKILVVEDDEISSCLISILLEKYSDKLINVNSGYEAVEECRNNTDIDLVLMDIQLPDMNGYEATRQIRQFNKDVIIIAQTAFALTGEREKSIEMGCNDYISKPINKSELDEIVKKYFSV